MPDIDDKGGWLAVKCSQFSLDAEASKDEEAEEVDTLVLTFSLHCAVVAGPSRRCRGHHKLLSVGRQSPPRGGAAQ